MSRYTSNINYYTFSINENDIKHQTEIILSKEIRAIQDIITLSQSEEANTITIKYSNADIRDEIIGYIETHLRNPNLSPEHIARQFNISRSHLYRSFQGDGGVARLIREKRLSNACRFMNGRGTKRISLKEIAYLCGFRNGAQFNKAFRNRYGFDFRHLQQMIMENRSNPPVLKDQEMTAPDRISLHVDPSE